MKSVALILCFVVVGTLGATLNDSEKAKLKEIHEKCQSDPATHVEDEFFQKLKAGEKPDPPATFGPHMLCMSKGAGLQKADGSLDKEVIKEKVQAAAEDKSQVDAIVTECAVEQETPEKTAGHLFHCFYTKHVNYRHEHDHGHH